MNYTLFGKRVREERLRLNLTQEKLSENISTAYLGKIECGERSITFDKLMPLANRLSVTIDFLLSDYITSVNNINLNRLIQLLQGKVATNKNEQ